MQNPSINQVDAFANVCQLERHERVVFDNDANVYASFVGVVTLGANQHSFKGFRISLVLFHMTVMDKNTGQVNPAQAVQYCPVWLAVRRVDNV